MLAEPPFKTSRIPRSKGASDTNARNTKARNTSALKRSDGTWVKEAADKAELFLETLTQKYTLPTEEANEHTAVDHLEIGVRLSNFVAVRARTATQVLKELEEDSGTGPDLLPARILKECAEELCDVVQALVSRMLLECEWPDN